MSKAKTLTDNGWVKNEDGTFTNTKEFVYTLDGYTTKVPADVTRELDAAYDLEQRRVK